MFIVDRSEIWLLCPCAPQHFCIRVKKYAQNYGFVYFAYVLPLCYETVANHPAFFIYDSFVLFQRG